MQKKIWIRKQITNFESVLFSLIAIMLVLAFWFVLTSADKSENRIISRNVLPNPVDIVKTFPSLIKGTSGSDAFVWKKSLFYAVWMSLSRELISFLLVIFLAMPIGIFMSCSNKARSFFWPLLIVGSFIPIAALIPLTQAIFGIGELQKIIFLTLGMFFVLLGLVMKEMDEVDDIYLHTAYTLGFSQLQTVFLVIFPAALPRIWKHLSSVFGIGWGYIIFAEMINTGGGDVVNGIGWLFIARQRRFQVADMYAIFFIIIFLAFLFSYLFKGAGYLLFKSERKQ
ncbi:MAG TPA: ABC transporter permease subunit [Spirochaetota bacterium]|nr:ABC transporter permease subunit [Spirochaetota bacterium]